MGEAVYAMTIQKHPMLTVREAASALGIDERTVREKLTSGQIKGEKRLIGLKEKWFVYRGEIETLIERQRLPRFDERSALEQSFGPESFDASPEQSEYVDAEVNERPSQVEELVAIIARQFAEKLDEEKRLIYDLKRELDDKDRQLRLLPDLEKRLREEEQNRNLESQKAMSLEKQVAAMKEEFEEKRVLAIQTLESTKQEKEAELKQVTEALSKLQREVQELKRPWWQKLFAPPEEEQPKSGV